MSRQTSLNGLGSRPSAHSDSERSVVGNAAGVMHDITELLELQTKLLASDSKAVVRRAVLPVVLVGVGLAVLLGSTPIALESLAEYFFHLFAWHRSLAFLAAASCGLIFSVLLLGMAWWRFRHVFDELNNSREELTRNISWIKQSLKTGGGASFARPTVQRRNNT